MNQYLAKMYISFLRIANGRERARSLPKASATPATIPVTAATTPRVDHAGVIVPGGAGTLETAAMDGARYPQNPTPMAAPVSVAANEPARDLRDAKGRGMRTEDDGC